MGGEEVVDQATAARTVAERDAVLVEQRRDALRLCLLRQRDEGGIQFRCRNSWASQWGDGGEVWLDAGWLGLGHCGELHAIRAIRRMA